MNLLGCYQRLFLWNLVATDAMVLQEDSVEGICQRFQCLFAHLRLQLTFPDGDAVPAHCGQLMLYLQVALLVSPYLCYPEVTIRLRNLTTFGTLNRKLDSLCAWLVQEIVQWKTNVVSMPETPVDKDARTIFPHHDVWFPWQPRMVQPIAEAMSPQPTAHYHLRLRVLAVDGRHVVVALLRVMTIHIRITFLVS